MSEHPRGPFVYCVLSAAVAPAGSSCGPAYDMRMECAQMTASSTAAYCSYPSCKPKGAMRCRRWFYAVVCVARRRRRQWQLQRELQEGAT